MGPCHACPLPGAFGFDARLARIRRLAGTIWSCAGHRAALPQPEDGALGMSAWTSQMDAALAVATERLAEFWIERGLGGAARQIGAENAREGARFLFDQFWAERERQLNAGKVDGIPY